ncbi:DUF6660 family protein [Adhaeribacter radiodurans]|uniref:Uncharacterized protein n=1 Tax=Adhaeribacter radiodurans TaxID=2745197 RepID=A0A7L7L163_9BACT|nr:DUF6660 family protein [Adhaeribacter radiodurans]QMU26527.1 hypothetical protein HUW48_00195 [Adhaeribacter radiodurans]
MKWVAVIFSFYLLVLSCIPCADAAPRDNAAQTAFSVDDNKAESHSSDVDLCSPLCLCTCCTGATLVHPAIKVESIPVQVNIPVPVYQPVSISHPTFSIWQPPQL